MHRADAPRPTVAYAASEISRHHVNVWVPPVASKPPLRTISRDDADVIASPARDFQIRAVVAKIAERKQPDIRAHASQGKRELCRFRHKAFDDLTRQFIG